MIKDNKQADKKQTHEPFRFKKRHGSTTFHVVVYSKHDATETVQDKIARLIRNEVEYFMHNDTAMEGASP